MKCDGDMENPLLGGIEPSYTELEHAEFNSYTAVFSI